MRDFFDPAPDPREHIDNLRKRIRENGVPMHDIKVIKQNNNRAVENHNVRLERVAKALLSTSSDNKAKWDSQPEYIQNQYRILAQSAIAAYNGEN